MHVLTPNPRVSFTLSTQSVREETQGHLMIAHRYVRVNASIQSPQMSKRKIKTMGTDRWAVVQQMGNLIRVY